MLYTTTSHMDCSENETGLLEFAEMLCVVSELKNENGRTGFIRNQLRFSLLQWHVLNFVPSVCFVLFKSAVGLLVHTCGFLTGECSQASQEMSSAEFHKWIRDLVKSQGFRYACYEYKCGVEVHLHLFLTMALDWGMCPSSALVAVCSGERAPVYVLNRRPGEPRSQSGRFVD